MVVKTPEQLLSLPIPKSGNVPMTPKDPNAAVAALVLSI